MIHVKKLLVVKEAAEAFIAVRMAFSKEPITPEENKLMVAIQACYAKPTKKLEEKLE